MKPTFRREVGLGAVRFVPTQQLFDDDAERIHVCARREHGPPLLEELTERLGCHPEQP